MLMWVDFAIIGVIALSALISLLRGFVREAMALVGWVAAVWVALTFTEALSVLFVEHISVPSMRLGAAALVLFIGTLLLSGMIVFLLGQLVDKTGLSGTDRLLGVLFGAARGVIIVAVVVTVAGLTPLTRDPWWQQSTLIPHFEQVAKRLRALLPPELSNRLPLPSATPAPPPIRSSSPTPATGGSTN